MAFINWESKNKPNANGSRYLGIGQIVLFLLGAALPWITGKLGVYENGVDNGFFITELLLGAGTWLSAVKVGFKNTFQTNDGWKSAVQAISAIANIIVPAIYQLG